MKKLLSVIVALFLCFGFAACEQKGKNSGADNMPEAKHQYDVARVKLDINAKKTVCHSATTVKHYKQERFRRHGEFNR